MEDILLVPVTAWMQAHPVASARLLGVVLVLLTLGNACKLVESRLPPELLKKHRRLKTALRIGQTVGNVMWGLVALVRHFIDNTDPDDDKLEGEGDSTT